MDIKTRREIETLLAKAEPSAQLGNLFIIMQGKMIAYYYGLGKGDSEISALMSLSPESVKAARGALGLIDTTHASYPSEWDAPVWELGIDPETTDFLARHGIVYVGDWKAPTKQQGD